MYVDKNLQCSAAQALSSASTISDYSVNLGDDYRDVGKGQQLYAIITVDTSAATADAADTVTFSVITDSTANLATSATTIASTGTYTGAVLTAGRAPIVIPIPMGIIDQYIGIYYTLSAAFTSFTVSACIGFDYQSNV
jgi:hypothetical protein